MTESQQIKVSSNDWQPAPATAPSPIIAIGDIHGCAHLLAALRVHLDREAPGAQRVYLGDLIDPAPKYVPNYDVVSVIDQVGDDVERGAVVLAGNHDQFFLIACDCERRRAKLPWAGSDPFLWLDQGGAETAAAWDVDTSVPAGFGSGVTRASEAAVAIEIYRRMNDRQRRVFDEMRVWFDHGAFLFVHAGFQPHVPLAKQQAQDWLLRFPTLRDENEHPLWLRFKNSTDAAPPGRVLVHGHTSMRRPIIGRKRIAIDSGSKYGGPLTAVEIVGEQLRLHQAWPHGVDAARWAKEGLR